MHLYNGRDKIIKLSEEKLGKPTNFPYNEELELEPKLEYESEYEPELEESIVERAKKR